MSKKYKLSNLDMHVTDACNMKCNHCLHFCNYSLGENIPFEIGYEWMLLWSKRLHPEIFHLLGGEPFLNKDLSKYIYAAARVFHESDRAVLTNGLLLTENEDILPVFIETDTSLVLSNHPTIAYEEQAFTSAVDIACRWREKGLKLQIYNSALIWRRFYQGEGKEIRPFYDGDPCKSFASCPNANVRIINHGKLYLCPPLAYLPMVVDKLSTKEEWVPYLAYKPLEADATDEELQASIDGNSNFCGMCPSRVIYAPNNTSQSPFRSMLVNSKLASIFRREISKLDKK